MCETQNLPKLIEVGGVVEQKDSPLPQHKRDRGITTRSLCLRIEPLQVHAVEVVGTSVCTWCNLLNFLHNTTHMDVCGTRFSTQQASVHSH